MTHLKSTSLSKQHDSGTGTNYRGLIVFDLAALKLTNVPVIAHDSLLLKEIEIEAVEKILKQYCSFEKQVFIAIDRTATFTEESQKIIDDTAVIRLYRDGGELFGYYWGKQQDDSK